MDISDLLRQILGIGTAQAELIPSDIRTRQLIEGMGDVPAVRAAQALPMPIHVSMFDQPKNVLGYTYTGNAPTSYDVTIAAPELLQRQNEAHWQKYGKPISFDQYGYSIPMADLDYPALSRYTLAHELGHVLFRSQLQEHLPFEMGKETFADFVAGDPSLAQIRALYQEHDPWFMRATPETIQQSLMQALGAYESGAIGPLQPLKIAPSYEERRNAVVQELRDAMETSTRKVSKKKP